MKTDIGVMAGRDKFTIEVVGPFQQSFPFDVRIAQHAGIGGTTGNIFIDEVVDHQTGELFPNI